MDTLKKNNPKPSNSRLLIISSLIDMKCKTLHPRSVEAKDPRPCLFSIVRMGNVHGCLGNLRSIIIYINPELHKHYPFTVSEPNKQKA